MCIYLRTSICSFPIQYTSQTLPIVLIWYIKNKTARWFARLYFTNKNYYRQIQENLTYVDAARTAIWGWSYGGYAAGMALATDTDNTFKCGISVAPVTDWALYGKFYNLLNVKLIFISP